MSIMSLCIWSPQILNIIRFLNLLFRSLFPAQMLWDRACPAATIRQPERRPLSISCSRICARTGRRRRNFRSWWRSTAPTCRRPWCPSPADIVGSRSSASSASRRSCADWREVSRSRGPLTRRRRRCGAARWRRVCPNSSSTDCRTSSTCVTQYARKSFSD